MQMHMHFAYFMILCSFLHIFVGQFFLHILSKKQLKLHIFVMFGINQHQFQLFSSNGFLHYNFLQCCAQKGNSCTFSNKTVDLEIFFKKIQNLI